MEFAMGLSFFVWLAVGTFVQNFPLLGVILTLVMGGAAIAFSPWFNAPFVIKEEDATLWAILLQLLFLIALAAATAVALFALATGNFPESATVS